MLSDFRETPLLYIGTPVLELFVGFEVAVEAKLHKQILLLLRLVVPNGVTVDIVAGLDVLVRMREGLLIYRAWRRGRLGHRLLRLQYHLHIV